MENLITQGVFSVNVRNDFNATPLHYAAFYGMQAMSVMLIKWGADLEARMSPIPITGNTDDRPLTPRNLCDLQGYGWCGLLGTDGNTSSSLESFELCSIQVMRVTMIPDILLRTWMTWLAARPLTARPSPSPTSRRWCWPQGRRLYTWTPNNRFLQGRRQRRKGGPTASFTMWPALSDQEAPIEISVSSTEPGTPTGVWTVKVRTFCNDFWLWQELKEWLSLGTLLVYSFPLLKLSLILRLIPQLINGASNTSSC